MDIQYKIIGGPLDGQTTLDQGEVFVWNVVSKGRDHHYYRYQTWYYYEETFRGLLEALRHAEERVRQKVDRQQYDRDYTELVEQFRQDTHAARWAIDQQIDDTRRRVAQVEAQTVKLELCAGLTAVAALAALVVTLLGV